MLAGSDKPAALREVQAMALCVDRTIGPKIMIRTSGRPISRTDCSRKACAADFTIAVVVGSTKRISFGTSRPRKEVQDAPRGWLFVLQNAINFACPQFKRGSLLSVVA